VTYTQPSKSYYSKFGNSSSSLPNQLFASLFALPSLLPWHRSFPKSLFLLQLMPIFLRS